MNLLWSNTDHSTKVAAMGCLAPGLLLPFREVCTNWCRQMRVLPSATIRDIHYSGASHSNIYISTLLAHVYSCTTPLSYGERLKPYKAGQKRFQIFLWHSELYFYTRANSFPPQKRHFLGPVSKRNLRREFPAQVESSWDWVLRKFPSQAQMWSSSSVEQ